MAKCPHCITPHYTTDEKDIKTLITCNVCKGTKKVSRKYKKHSVPTLLKHITDWEKRNPNVDTDVYATQYKHIPVSIPGFRYWHTYVNKKIK